MPVDSKFTDQVITWMAKTGRPVTVREISDATGMSRQNAYAWVDTNAWRLREVGTGLNNARAYVLADDSELVELTAQAGSNFRPSGSWQVKPKSKRHAPSSTDVAKARSVSGGAGDLRVGMLLTVVAIRLEGSDVVADLQTEDSGVKLTVVVA